MKKKFKVAPLHSNCGDLTKVEDRMLMLRAEVSRQKSMNFM